MAEDKGHDEMNKNNSDHMENEKVFDSTSFWHICSPINVAYREKLSYLKDIGESAHFIKDDIIFRTGDIVNDLYIIEKGIAKAHLFNMEGKEKIVGFLDSFIALDGVFHKQPIICNVSAFTDTDCIIIREKSLHVLMQDLEIMQLIIESLSRQSRVLGWQIYDLCLQTNKERLCRILSSSATSSNNLDFYVYLNQQVLADMAGIHRVTVTRILGELKKEAVISIEGKSLIKIIDLSKIYSYGFGKIYR